MTENNDPSNNQLERPVPRQPRSDSHNVRIQAQNRRREYLVRHPSYFESLEHELADPVLYERLVKHFHSAAEREAEGKAKGYGRTLEAALQRGESKLAHMHQTNGGSKNGTNGKEEADAGLDNAWDQPAENKEHGLQLWRDFLEDRFVRGRDEEFDYSSVDDNDEYDALSRTDAEDAWFDEEEPSWVEDDHASDAGEERQLEGETGIQDF